MNESYNLGNVDAMTYNGNEVETLTLDGTTIWEGLKDYSIAVTATFDEETRMITVNVITGKDLLRWNYEASIAGNRQYHNDYYPIYTASAVKLFNLAAIRLMVNYPLLLVAWMARGIFLLQVGLLFMKPTKIQVLRVQQ